MPCVLQRIGPEEYPSKTYFPKGEQKGEKAALALRFYAYFQDLVNAVNSAPYDIVDAGAVPESAGQEGKNQIQAMPEGAFAAAAQGNIYIIPEPSGERNMPAAPELADAVRKVRAFKVLLQFDPEELGAADGNIRIPGKVAINLDGKHNSCDREDQSGIIGGIIVNAVYGRSQQFCDHQLLKIAHGHQFQAVRRLGRSEGASFFELGKQDIAPSDGAGKELGEKGDEQAVITEMPFRRVLSPIDVNEVSQCLKSIE